MCATTLQDIVLGYIRGIDDGKWARQVLDCENAFGASPEWIRKTLRGMDLSYKRVTNSAGKLPSDWEEEKVRMLLRTAILCATHDIPLELVFNIDETPIYLNPSTKYTWSERGASNTAAHGAKDKTQYTLVPIISAAGDLVHMQLVFQGSTADCGPSQLFQQRHQDLFKNMSFTFSENHWVTKGTTRRLLKKLQSHVLDVISKSATLQDGQKAVLLWDCYCRHIDADTLRAFVKVEFLFLHSLTFVVLTDPY